MIADAPRRIWRRVRDWKHVAVPARADRTTVPILEALEARELLSFYNGPAATRPVISNAGLFQIQVSGPGVVNVRPAAQGAIDLIAYGTTSATILNITQTQPRYHFPNQLLLIHNLVVRSGQLGGLEAAPAELKGRLTPLNNAVSNLALGALGPKSQVDINGSVAAMNIGSVALGPTGHVAIAGDLAPASSSSSSQSSPATLGGVTIGTLSLDGGRFAVGRDALEPVTIEGDLTILHDGQLAIGRDATSPLIVNGSVRLNSGGQILIGRNVENLAVGGNLLVSPSGSGVAVGGALNGLTVGGYFQGQGGTSAPSVFDLGVGLNLNSLTILGGVPGQGGLINANIRAGGSISNVNIVYGSVNSTIRPNTPPP
jgi:hypothetical protein